MATDSCKKQPCQFNYKWNTKLCKCTPVDTGQQAYNNFMKTINNSRPGSSKMKKGGITKSKKKK